MANQNTEHCNTQFSVCCPCPWRTYRSPDARTDHGPFIHHRLCIKEYCNTHRRPLSVSASPGTLGIKRRAKCQVIRQESGSLRVLRSRLLIIIEFWPVGLRGAAHYPTLHYLQRNIKSRSQVPWQFVRDCLDRPPRASESGQQHPPGSQTLSDDPGLRQTQSRNQCWVCRSWFISTRLPGNVSSDSFVWFVRYIKSPPAGRSW